MEKKKKQKQIIRSVKYSTSQEEIRLKILRSYCLFIIWFLPKQIRTGFKNIINQFFENKIIDNKYIQIDKKYKLKKLQKQIKVIKK